MISTIVVGSGNVAAMFCERINQSKQLALAAIIARNTLVGQELSDKFGTTYINVSATDLPAAQLIIIAVSDAAIADMAKIKFSGDPIVVHTAGAVVASVLQKSGNDYGVLYPFQTIRGNPEAAFVTPILYHGSSDTVTRQLATIASQLSPVSYEVDDEQRLRYHLSGVLVNNFGNHLFTLAHDYCKKHDLDFSLLHPIIQNTAAKILTSNPADAQTGPAMRKDEGTIEKHRQLLQDEPQLKKLYDMFTASIQQQHER